jgi:hypothetical protein
LGREMVQRNYNLNAEIDKLARLFLAHAGE